MPLWLILILLSLASFRLTRLIVLDTFPPIAIARRWIQHARPTVQRKVDVHKDGLIFTGTLEEYWWLGELVGCTWCASAYTSGGTVVIWWACYGLQAPVLCWLAVWGAAAYLSVKTT
jgi:hypothetical protein